jgi:hypothetical protein
MGVRRLLPLFAMLAACDSDDSLESINTRATAVVVDPAEFLGAFPCGQVEGAPQSYRATVTVLEEPATKTDDALAAQDFGPSERVGCGTPIAFTEVESGRRYVAKIEAFDVPPDAEAGEPAWTTTCGDNEPAVGRLLEQVTIRDCVPLDGAGTAQTGIIVDASAAVGALRCFDVPEGETPGLIDTLSVTNTTEEDGDTVTIACGQDPVRFDSEIEPGETYTFRIEGEDAEGNVVASASCEAVAREGLVVPAICQPLGERAELIIPVVELLEAEGIVCGEDATEVRAALTAGPTTTPLEALPCDRDVAIAGVLPGSYLALLEVFDENDAVIAFSCTGVAPPGSETTLVCSPED